MEKQKTAQQILGARVGFGAGTCGGGARSTDGIRSRIKKSASLAIPGEKKSGLIVFPVARARVRGGTPRAPGTARIVYFPVESCSDGYASDLGS